MNRKLVDTLTGLFVIAAALVVVFFLVSGARVSALLQQGPVIRTWLPRALVQEGSSVTFRGYPVGTVRSVEPRFWHDPAGAEWFEVRIQLDQDFADAITDAFTTTIESSPLGQITGANLLLVPPGDEDLDAGSPPQRIGTPLSQREGPVTLTFVQPTSVIDQLRTQFDQLMPFVQEAVRNASELIERLGDPKGDLMLAVANLRAASDELLRQDGDFLSALRRLRGLADELARPEGPVLAPLAKADRLIGHVNEILRGLEAGEGAAGALLRDPATREDVRGLIAESRGLLEEGRKMLASAQPAVANASAATAELPAMLASLRAILARLETASQDLPGIAQEVQALLIETDETLRAVQQLPFIRSRVGGDEPPDPLIVPTTLGGGGS